MLFLLLFIHLINTANTDKKDWLSVNGNKIVDSNQKEVWLTGVNWFGYNTGLAILDGLYTVKLESSLDAIANHGFNFLRLPFSLELLYQWSQGQYPEPNFNDQINNNLIGKNSLEIWDYILSYCREVGIKVMIDIHSVKTDPYGHEYPLWYNGEWTTERVIQSLRWIAERHKNDDTVIAYDLKNEPHGVPGDSNGYAIWDDSASLNNFKYFCEQAASSIFSVNPNVLILVEGIEVYPIDISSNPHFTSTSGGDYRYAFWGGQLRGVKDNPINFGDYQNKLVYSPHDYGPAIYGQPWFHDGYTSQSVMDEYWNETWFFIHEKNIAPLLIGEWGGRVEPATTKWMIMLRDLIKDNHLHHTFWCFNPNSGDTGGLVESNWSTWDEAKYEIIKPALWEVEGKFVSLYHSVRLGTNGKSLNDVYGDNNDDGSSSKSSSVFFSKFVLFIFYFIFIFV